MPPDMAWEGLQNDTTAAAVAAAIFTPYSDEEKTIDVFDDRFADEDLATVVRRGGAATAEEEAKANIVFFLIKKKYLVEN